jgi:hypothetical protein
MHLNLSIFDLISSSISAFVSAHAFSYSPPHDPVLSLLIVGTSHFRAASRAILLVCHLFLLKRCAATRTAQSGIRLCFHEAVFKMLVIALDPMSSPHGFGFDYGLLLQNVNNIACTTTF